ncbi:WD40-repeat-containing domain protein [Phialemonium atrogriseum]|uniref:WD40-repeat-containing domain protein n=1 Tax=Phialemonium atrogriseum TaxID=1093897 RepID=A0AAJ0C601_9PEZI|nr:WD40-repeat-containing domain protein [Phialemonium atrogriseum]KAK1769339.1 WD40-repeat-containing domain protein [Phialemonium atrogriseum]
MSSLYKPKPTGTSSSTTGSIANDVELPVDATDTITSIRWSPVANHLAAASWDGKVRIYDVTNDGKAQGVAMINAEGPAFSCDWSKDGTMITAGGADKKVHLLQAASGQAISFTAHKAPIRAVRFADIPSAAAPIIASGSWDSTVSYWDIRQTASPLATLQCSDRVYSMDTNGRLLVIATADLNMHLVDLHTNPASIMRTQPSQLKHQTKAVAAASDGRHWSAGSIEGRCAATAVDETEAKSYNFTWRCHRGEPDAKKMVKVWAVNDISFHPFHKGILASVGADGTYSFWDLVGHSRLKLFPNVGGSITSAAFNRDGKLFAYAVGYDWSLGYAHSTPQYPRKLMLHPVKEDEVSKAARI